MKVYSRLVTEEIRIRACKHIQTEYADLKETLAHPDPALNHSIYISIYIYTHTCVYRYVCMCRYIYMYVHV